MSPNSHCPEWVSKAGLTCGYSNCSAYITQLYQNTCSGASCNCNNVAPLFADDVQHAHNKTYKDYFTLPQIAQWESINTYLGECKNTGDRCLYGSSKTSCHSGDKCDTGWFTGKCVRDETCNSDKDCLNYTSPLSNTCLNNGANGGHCAVTNMVCRTKNQEWRKACTTSTDCGAGETCESRSIVSCNQDSECPSKTTCYKMNSKNGILGKLTEDAHIQCGLNWKNIFYNARTMDTYADIAYCKQRWVCQGKDGKGGVMCDPMAPVCDKNQSCVKDGDVADKRCTWSGNRCDTDADCYDEPCIDTVDCSQLRATDILGMCRHFGMYNVIPLKGTNVCKCAYCYEPKFCTTKGGKGVNHQIVKIKGHAIPCTDNTGCGTGETCTNFKTLRETKLSADAQTVMDNYCTTKLSCGEVAIGKFYCGSPTHVLGNLYTKENKYRCQSIGGTWDGGKCRFIVNPERKCNLYGGSWVKDKNGEGACVLIDSDAACTAAGGVPTGQGDDKTCQVASYDDKATCQNKCSSSCFYNVPPRREGALGVRYWNAAEKQCRTLEETGRALRLMTFATEKKEMFTKYLSVLNKKASPPPPASCKDANMLLDGDNNRMENNTTNYNKVCNEPCRESRTVKIYDECFKFMCVPKFAALFGNSCYFKCNGRWVEQNYSTTCDRCTGHVGNIKNGSRLCYNRPETISKCEGELIHPSNILSNNNNFIKKQAFATDNPMYEKLKDNILATMPDNNTYAKYDSVCVRWMGQGDATTLSLHDECDKLTDGNITQWKDAFVKKKIGGLTHGLFYYNPWADQPTTPTTIGYMREHLKAQCRRDANQYNSFTESAGVRP